jgi:hypothetical protein
MWPAAIPVPLSGSEAVAVGLLLVAVTVALSLAGLAGANCTVMVQDLPGPRLVALQVSLVRVNVLEPNNLSSSLLLADPPELARLKVFEAVSPTAIDPKA